MASSVIASLVHSALSAASHAEAADHTDSNDFDSLVHQTRRSFRRVTESATGSATTDARQRRKGRKKVTYWKVTVCLLRRSAVDFFPRPEECSFLTQNGFGFAKVNINRYQDITELERTLEMAYPTVPLSLVGFKLCHLGKGKRILEIPTPASVSDVENHVARGKLVLVPLRDIPWPEVVSAAGLSSQSAGLSSTSAGLPSQSAGLYSTSAGLSSQSAGLSSQSAGLYSTSAGLSSLVMMPVARPEPVSATTVNQNYEWQDGGTPSISFRMQTRTTANVQPVQPNLLLEGMSDRTTTITTDVDDTITIPNDDTVEHEFAFHNSVDDSDLQTVQPIVVDESTSVFDSIAAIYSSLDVQEVVIKRKSLVNDMLTLYGTPDILLRKLKVTFDGEEGDDFGGLTKELFTSFWASAYETYFRGENCKVPFLPLYRMRKESTEYVAIGRILTHMVGLTQTLPCLVARSSLISLVFNEAATEECLLEDLLLFVTETERVLIRRALCTSSRLNDNDFSHLTDFFVHNELQELPKATELRQQILSIATNILVTKPQPFIALMRKGLPQLHVEQFWSQLTVDDLTAVIQLQRPTPGRVAESLRMATDTPRPEEEAAFYNVTQFVRGLDMDSLQAFLQFVTGSVDMPITGITVSFFGSDASARHVVAHTCSNTLDVSTAYSTYQEFKREMSLMLRSESSFEFTLM